MPRLSVWMVRAALLHWGVGFTLGALMLYNKGNLIDPTLWRLRPLHIELLLLGWTLQLAMGVAFWIMPRLSGERKYGVEWLAWAAFVLFNAGILILAVGLWVGDASPVLSLLSRALELAAALLFMIQLWPRVKAFGAQTGLSSKPN